MTSDGEVYARLESVAANLIASGVDPQTAFQNLAQPVRDVLYRHGERIADELISSAEGVLARERRNERVFQDRLRTVWSEAFDYLYLVGYGTAECADRFIDQHESTLADDDVFHALVRLHERSRRVFWEVHRLLTGGLAGGARARARTLHELAVVALVIARYGRDPQTTDLATRYLDHSVIGKLAMVEFDASLYEERESEVPSELSQKIDELRDIVEDLKLKYGNFYDHSTGWSVPLLPLLPPARRQNKKSPSIADLEFLAGQGHMRMTYGLMSAEVHAGADGLIYNLDPLDDSESPRGPSSIIGPHLAGLAEPGRHALVGLHLSTWALLTAATGDENTPIEDLLALRTLEAMIRRYVDESDAAEQLAQSS